MLQHNFYQSITREEDTLQGELDGLNEQMTELEAAIAEKYPEIAEKYFHMKWNYSNKNDKKKTGYVENKYRR